MSGADVDGAGAGSAQQDPLNPDYEHRLAKQAAVAALVAVQQTRAAAQIDQGAAAGADGRDAGGFATPARAVRKSMPTGTWARRI